MSDSAGHSSESTSAIDHLKTLLRQTLRVTINDGRVFIGSFVGTDKPLNILLVNTEEFRVQEPGRDFESRYVGQVMIPWRLVVKAEVQGNNRSEEKLRNRVQSLYI